MESAPCFKYVCPLCVLHCDTHIRFAAFLKLSLIFSVTNLSNLSSYAVSSLCTHTAAPYNPEPSKTALTVHSLNAALVTFNLPFHSREYFTQMREVFWPQRMNFN